MNEESDENALCKIAFAMDDEADVESERFWARRTESGSYILENAPFFVPGIAVEDEFLAEGHDDEAWATELIGDGGHATVWVEGLERKHQKNHVLLAEVSLELEKLGCYCEIESTNPRLAVDIESADNIDEIISLLYRLEDAGKIGFAVAKTMDWLTALLRDE